MRKRGLWFGREVDGSVPFRGRMLPDVAEQFRLLSDAHLNPRAAEPVSTPGTVAFVEAANDEHDGVVVPEDFRTRAHKLHDVLESVLSVAGRAAENPTIGGAPPTLLVTVEASEMQRHDGVAFIVGTDTAVPAFVARQIGCSGGAQRLVIGDEGRVLELGGPQRVFAAHQRRAIAARDGGCVIPGCHVGAAWC